MINSFAPNSPLVLSPRPKASPVLAWALQAPVLVLELVLAALTLRLRLRLLMPCRWRCRCECVRLSVGVLANLSFKTNSWFPSRAQTSRR